MKVLVVGDVMTDIVTRLAEPFAWRSDAAAEIAVRPGGSAATFAVCIAQAGIDVDFVARVGARDVERLTEAFRARGVNAHLAGDPNLPTGRLVALIEPTGERSFLTDRAANDALRLADIPPSAISGADWLHLTGYTFRKQGPRAAARDLMRRVGEVPVSIDPGSAEPLRAMGPVNFLRWTTGAAVLFPNADEAAVLTGVDSPDAQRERLRGRYPLVVVKRGAKGAEAFTASAHWSRPSPPVATVDTTGAGDAFAAAFVAARLKGDDVESALELAVAAGAAATTYIGARPR